MQTKMKIVQIGKFFSLSIGASRNRTAMIMNLNTLRTSMMNLNTENNDDDHQELTCLSEHFLQGCFYGKEDIRLLSLCLSAVLVLEAPRNILTISNIPSEGAVVGILLQRKTFFIM